MGKNTRNLVLMKGIFVFLSIINCLSFISQSGRVMESLSFRSDILKSDRKYAIYLPADYESSERSYPVLYLLHGSGDDQSGWIQFGEVLKIADQAIKNGNSTSMIIVMPDAQTGQKGYFNTISEKWNYEDFFFQDLIPYIEKKYRIKSEKRFRAIAGLSMGGGGSFIYALRHPQFFSSSCALSAAMGDSSFDVFYNKNKNSFQGRKREDLYNYFSNHNALSIIKNQTDENLKSVRWYIDCGDDDFLFEGNSLVHIALKKKNIPHEYRVRDGEHNWTYWRSALPSVLKFVSDHFHQI